MARRLLYSSIMLCTGIAAMAPLGGACNETSELPTYAGERHHVGKLCRCPGSDMCNRLEDSSLYRCEKCEAREREKRERFAQNIILNIAQFLGGIAMLAQGGKEADDKVKAEQCLAMAQAVGNILYHTHEYHRYVSNTGEYTEIDSHNKSRHILDKELYQYVHNVMLDFIVNNPDFCLQTLNLTTP